MRPILFPALALALWAGLSAGPAEAAQPPLAELDRLSAIARKEGLPLSTIRLVDSTRLHLASESTLGREAFLKRASLLAYVAFKQMGPRVTVIEFQNGRGAGSQHCAIKAADLTAYLAGGISKVEYERRLAYRQAAGTAFVHAPPAPLRRAAPPALPEVPAQAIAAKPLLPQAPRREPLKNLLAPARPAVEIASAPTISWPQRAGTVIGLTYGMALGGSRYDAYQLEYGHPILSTLDLRPSIQIISAFSPLNYMSATQRTVDGLSFACDLLGTTRQQPGLAGLAFEGGLGARVASLQGANQVSEAWPAMHLRVGLRWYGATLGMRYPLLHRANDPTGSWEAQLGYSVPFSAFSSDR